MSEKANKILIVDDLGVVINRLKKILEGSGYEILCASNGAEGLKTFKESEDIDMLLCDIHMPKMNGFQMLEAAQTEVPHYAQVKKIMITTEYPEPEFQLKAKELGVVGWLKKPIQKVSLLQNIEKIFAEN